MPQATVNLKQHMLVWSVFSQTGTMQQNRVDVSSCSVVHALGYNYKNAVNYPSQLVAEQF